jgi:hypothetical protein
LGLGSLTLGVWMVNYRWVFVLVTIVFLGIAYYRTFFRKRRSADAWGKRMLYVTTALSLGLVGYTLLFR